MYSRKLIHIMDNDADKRNNQINKTLYATANEPVDDVKIYIRHNAGGIVKDFYEKFKIEKESRKFQWE